MGKDELMAQATQPPLEANFGIFERQRDYALKMLNVYKTLMEGHVLVLRSFVCTASGGSSGHIFT
jgi:hypothetical protein